MEEREGGGSYLQLLQRGGGAAVHFIYPAANGGEGRLGCQGRKKGGQ